VGREGPEGGNGGDELSDGEKEDTGTEGAQRGEQGASRGKKIEDAGIPDPEITLVAPTPARPSYIPN
jgi:hypothetical protein